MLFVSFVVPLSSPSNTFARLFLLPAIDARRRTVDAKSMKRGKQQPVLTVESLRIERSGTTILDGIDWEIQPGEHWVILGANGSGKTSMLSALTGYFTPTAGDIYLLGDKYGEADWRELRTRIGMVSSSIRELMAEEEPALETVVTGKYAMIDLWGRIKPEDRKEAEKILKLIECEYLADRPWGVLSQGERQRILIGRALMSRPRLLILDEPCAGLDPAAREHFLQFLERLGQKRNAPCLVLVSHHVEEIMPVFTHVLVLKDGRVQAQGPKSKMLKSELLSETFDATLRVSSRNKRYAMNVTADSKGVM